MKKILFTILLLPLVTLAQASELSVGNRVVSYDTMSETEVGTLYFQGETLVASEHTGVTLVYENDQVVLEAHDSDGDGQLDVFLTLDSSEEVSNMTGEGAANFERPEVVEFEELVQGEGGSEAAAQEDLVGSLDSINIPGGGLPWGMILVVLLIAGGGFWYYKNKKMEAELG